jgi:hydroxypyruvate isomerase
MATWAIPYSPELRPSFLTIELLALLKHLKFAPHLGLFAPGPGTFFHTAGADPVAQIKCAHSFGFQAVCDNFLQLRDLQEQDRIGRVLADRGMSMGCFVAIRIFDRVTFASADKDTRHEILATIREALKTAKRVNGRWLTLIPGQAPEGVARERQKSQIVDNLQRCAELAERDDVVLLVEALNHLDRPGMMLADIAEAADVVRKVRSPACRLVFDTYHVSRESNDIFRKLQEVWDSISYFQFGDVPDRCEPGTGSTDFPRLVSELCNRNYEGIIDMEHHAKLPGAEGELAVVEAYRNLQRVAQMPTR